LHVSTERSSGKARIRTGHPAFNGFGTEVFHWRLLNQFLKILVNGAFAAQWALGAWRQQDRILRIERRQGIGALCRVGFPPLVGQVLGYRYSILTKGRASEKGA